MIIIINTCPVFVYITHPGIKYLLLVHVGKDDVDHVLSLWQVVRNCPVCSYPTTHPMLATNPTAKPPGGGFVTSTYGESSLGAGHCVSVFRIVKMLKTMLWRFALHIQLSFNSHFEIIYQIPAWAYK